MQSLFTALYAYFLSPVLTLIFILLIVYVVFSWLLVGNVVSLHNPLARQIWTLLQSVIEPLVQPIRRYFPPLGQLDLSIFILALAILFLRDWLLPTVINAMPG